LSESSITILNGLMSQDFISREKRYPLSNTRIMKSLQTLNGHHSSNFSIKFDIGNINFRQCFKNCLPDMELFATAIGNKPYACKNIRVLNLSMNNLTKEHAKLLAPELQDNKTIEVLDLSHNQFGVYGTTLIASALEKNTSVKTLNMFKNKFDVDGARAIGKLLKANQNIEWLDIGHNRIRQKGLEAIQQGLVTAKKSNLKTLAIRMNFINDDGI